VNKIEDGLEGFIYQVGKVILYLLGTLYVEEVGNDAAKPIQVLIRVHILILYLFYL